MVQWNLSSTVTNDLYAHQVNKSTYSERLFKTRPPTKLNARQITNEARRVQLKIVSIVLAAISAVISDRDNAVEGSESSLHIVASEKACSKNFVTTSPSQWNGITGPYASSQVMVDGCKY